MISKYELVKIQNFILKRKGQKKNETINNFFRKKGVQIGENCKIFSNISTTESYLIELGNNITISTDVKFITHDNSIAKINNKYTDVFGKIKVGDNCFIGANTIILPGVTLSKNIIVGAGSVVTKSFTEENIIIAGNPAKKISTFEENKNKTEKMGANIRKMSTEEKKEYILNKVELIEK